MEKYLVAWRKCVRRIFDLPRTTPRKYLSAIIQDNLIDHAIERQYLKFISKCMSSDNRILRISVQTGLSHPLLTCKNINFLSYKYRISRELLLSTKLPTPQISDENKVNGGLIRDMSLYKTQCNAEDRENINFMIRMIIVNS